MGLLKSFKEQSIRRGLSGLPSMFTTKEFAQLELTPGGGVVRSGADTDLMYSIHHVGGEGPCSNSADVVGIKNKGLVSGEKEASQFEGGAMLPPTFKTPEEGRPQRSWGSRGRTPKSRSRAQSNESLCSTPSSRSSKKSDRRSLSGGKSGSWQYHSSMFSPGDTFWDEAIEAVDGLILPMNGILPKKSSIGKSLLSSAEKSAHAVDGAIGTTEDVGAELCLDTSEKSPAEISVLNLDGMTSTDRIFNKRFDELDISPLPVRRFSFTFQNSPPSKSIIKSETEGISNVSSVAVQLASGEEPLDVKEILSADQATAGANIGVVGVSTKLQVGIDLQPKAEAVAVTVAPVGDNATSTFLPLPAPSTSAEPSTSGQIGAYAHASAEEESEAIVAGAVVPKVEHAFISSSLKTTSLELSDWLPPEACVMYAKKGLKRLYSWQVTLLYCSFNMILASVYSEALRSESEEGRLLCKFQR